MSQDGGGGYTIMHTESGDLYAVGAEPRRERAPRKQSIQLWNCRVYNAENPVSSTRIVRSRHIHYKVKQLCTLIPT